MFQQTDLLEEAAWEEPVQCRRTATRSKPPQRYSPRFDKPRRSKSHRGKSTSVKVRGTRI